MQADINRLTEQVIGAAIEVHKAVGPGLMEGVYEACMVRELTLRQIAHRQQTRIPLEYKGMRLDASLRCDLLVEDRLVVELKAVETLLPVHEAQLLTDMRLSGCPVGLFINFHVPALTQGVRRMVL